MAKGILGGFLAGAVLSGVALGTASVLMGPPPGVEAPRASGVEVPAGSEFNRAREDEEAALPAAEQASPEAVDAPQVPQPAPDDLSSLEEADTEPTARPETGEPEGQLQAPEVQSSGMNVDEEAAPLPSPQAMAPEAPDEEDLSISTEPAQPAQPVVEEESGFASGATSGDAETGSAAPEAQAEPVLQPQPEIVEEEETSEESAETGSAPQPAAPETVEETGVEAEESATGGTIGDRAEGVTTNRLPSVSDAPADEAEADLPPLQRYAAEFSNPEGKPLMAIVLIDDGTSPISHDALADFPYPVSYALDAGWPGAAEAAADYRAAGLEVLAMANLPEGASAVDAEVAMQTYLSAVPEAVAVMEGTGTGLQSSRAATEQLIPILQESGHGLVLFSEGLDTAQKLIAREGVPVATVFRDFDDKGQNATVIRRFLDQAAFKAGQEEGGVVMVGRLRAETVSALLLWGLQDRAASVALAPVSAILME
ncbi:MAG: divergent polysaccharide deacetylase family protein [Roseovarius sp.]